MYVCVPIFSPWYIVPMVSQRTCVRRQTERLLQQNQTITNLFTIHHNTEHRDGNHQQSEEHNISEHQELVNQENERIILFDEHCNQESINSSINMVNNPSS